MDEWGERRGRRGRRGEEGGEVMTTERIKSKGEQGYLREKKGGKNVRVKRKGWRRKWKERGRDERKWKG